MPAGPPPNPPIMEAIAAIIPSSLRRFIFDMQLNCNELAYIILVFREKEGREEGRGRERRKRGRKERSGLIRQYLLLRKMKAR
jgi:hypothetical protein